MIIGIGIVFMGLALMIMMMIGVRIIDTLILFRLRSDGIIVKLFGCACLINLMLIIDSFAILFLYVVTALSNIIELSKWVNLI